MSLSQRVASRYLRARSSLPKNYTLTHFFMSYSGFKEIEVRMEDRGVRVGEATAILEKFTVESISKFKCGEEMIALINRIPKLIDSDGKVRVVEVEWSDVEKDYRSQGIGLLMYEKLISESL